MRKFLLRFSFAALTLIAAGAFTISLPQTALAAGTVIVPPLPFVVDPGLKPFLVGHAYGSQNYVCRPSGAGFAYFLYTPEATLFDDDFKQLITHFFAPNPDEANTEPKTIGERMIRAAWQDSQDSSEIWAKAIEVSTDANFVRVGAVAWVKLEVVGKRGGPDGGDRLSKSKLVLRVNTDGGLPPATGCASAADIGNQAFMPYTADYFFFQTAD